MTTLNGFAYGELSFGSDGSVSDPAARDTAPPVALGADVTDLLVLSHGWNDDPPAARNLYNGLTAAMARCGGGPPGLAVLGILWPAKRYDAAPAVAASATTVTATSAVAGAATTVTATTTTVATAAAATTGGARAEAADGAAVAAAAAESAIAAGAGAGAAGGGGAGGTGSDAGGAATGVGATSAEAANARAAAVAFVEGVRADLGATLAALPATPAWADPGDHQEVFFGMEPQALVEHVGVSDVLNLATYYAMKARSGAVGRGLAGVMKAVRAERPYLRLHLAGHSFGARVMASALTAGEALPVSSATLIQGAFSHYGFARKWDGVHDGLFRPALVGGRLTGPMVVTYSHHDEVLGIAYAIASRMAHQADSALGPVGGRHDKFGALGSNGALATPESVWAPMEAFGGQEYAFIAGAVTNLDASAYIPGHTHISCDEVGKAIMAAINTNEIGTTDG